MSGERTCPRCGGELWYLHAQLRGGGCQATSSCEQCGWEETHLSPARPEDRWGDAWPSIREVFVQRIVALLAPEARDVAGVREVLVEGSAEGFGPWDLYDAAVRACPETWAPLPAWPAVAPRSRRG
jgi:hypothetical protein